MQPRRDENTPRYHKLAAAYNNITAQSTTKRPALAGNHPISKHIISPNALIFEFEFFPNNDDSDHGSDSENGIGNGIGIGNDYGNHGNGNGHGSDIGNYYTHHAAEAAPATEEQRTAAAFKYTKVANRVKPVPTTLPEDFRIIRRAHPEPLKDMPKLPTHPPDFTPGRRYTQERHDAMNIDPENFLTDEERKLAHHFIRIQEDAFAWEESEKGRFSDEWFDPVVIPTIEHVPWALKPLPIPPGLRDDIVKIIKDKIASGSYEPSNSSYRSRWHVVVKKDGKSLRLVHDLRPLNQVTIKDAGLPPDVEQLAEHFAGRACYSVMDLFVAFDQRKLDVRSRDLTTFQTPLGTLRLTAIPMGATNSMQIMHGDVSFTLAPEIPEFTAPFVDDVGVRGPATRYELPEGGYETIPENPGIRRFVWEHFQDLNRVVQRLKVIGATVSGKKLTICAPTAIIVGHKVTYEGRVPDDTKVQKVRDWPPCASLTEVRGFLGLCGVLRIFIKDFAKIARPLVNLTRKDVDFEWTEDHQDAMDALKSAVCSSPALRPLDYKSDRPVILSVDSSVIGFGYVLAQLGADKKRYPNRFGSGNWNERESRYSQAKIELHGLFRSLRALRPLLIGVQKLIVEVDAKYIKGMINNPDIQPNAAVNRWIAGILLFDFELKHVPAARHTGPDGLSRRPAAPEDPAESGDEDDWIDSACAFSLVRSKGDTAPRVVDIPRKPQAVDRDERLQVVRQYLVNQRRPDGFSDAQLRALISYASRFFVQNDSLWRRRPDGRHQKVIPPPKRLALIAEAHDNFGHKGVFAVRAQLIRRFWWPFLEDDVKWYVRTCHQCQVRQFKKVRIPPTVAMPAPLFHKAYMDSMMMPSGKYDRIFHARDSLTNWPEWRMMRGETGEAVAKFIFEEILCRWGALSEIVTDNGPPIVAGVQVLSAKYKINHIRISGYNSQANGIVERRHLDVREAIIKTVQDKPSQWPTVVAAIFWAERVTIQKSTGQSPFALAHGTEPSFPFDIAEATFLLPPMDKPLSSSELLALRGMQLRLRDQDLDQVRDRVLKARFKSVEQFKERFANTIVDYDFKPGDLVLVRNKAVETSHSRKQFPRYLGPYAVVRRTEGGSYFLTELDGAFAKRPYAAFRLVPYYPRSKLSVPVTKLVSASDDELDAMIGEAEVDQPLTDVDDRASADSDTDEED